MADEDIKTVKSSGGDYTSLDAWEAGEQADIVAADKIAVAEVYAFEDTTAFTIAGWTVDSTRYIIVRTPTTERHAGAWSDAKQRLVVDVLTSGQSPIIIQEAYTKIQGLQVKTTASASFRSAIRVDAVTDVEIGYCILQHSGSAGFQNAGIYVTGATASNIKFFNSIAYGYLGSENAGVFMIGTNNSISCYNNVLYNCLNGILRSGSGSVVATNCAVFTNTDDFNGASITVDYCASDDGDGTNAVTPTDWTTVFTDYPNFDFSLLSTDTDLIDAGDDDPGSGLYSDDIIGNTRVSPWDIGAFELIISRKLQKDVYRNPVYQRRVYNLPFTEDMD